MSAKHGEVRISHLFWSMVVVGLVSVRLVFATPSVDVNSVAEQYVKLVLEIGLYEPDYVDSYYGPPEWKPGLDTALDEFPAKVMRAKVQGLVAQLEGIDRQSFDEIEKLRLTFLCEQLRAVQGKIDLFDGAEMSFDEESKVLYGAVLPPFEKERYQRVSEQLDKLLPGQRDIGTRLNDYNGLFVVPKDKAKEAIKVTIAQYRKWTTEHITLPDEEGFDIEYVYGKPWMAFLTYKGDGRSLVQVNLGRSLTVVEIEIVAGHELYPGHHSHAVLLDKHLYRGRGWVEFSIMPLNSPLTTIAEGVAEYGFNDLVAGPADRVEFRRKVLFPLVGIDPNEAQRYSQVMALANELWGPRIEAARLYLDQTMGHQELMPWIRQYCVVAPGAEYGVFGSINAFGSYLITYSVGRTLVGDYMTGHSGPDANRARRWELFHRLLSTPQTPSSLRQAGQ